MLFVVWTIWISLNMSHAGSSGFFRVENTGPRQFRLVDPQGRPFYSLGVNHITSYGDESRTQRGQYPYRQKILAKHLTEQTWAEKTRHVLKNSGVNTLGLWSETQHFPGIPYTLSMECSKDYKGGQFRQQDFWDPGFENFARIKAQQVTTGRVGDPFLVGYFLDNENPWGRDHREIRSHLQVMMELPAHAAGKLRLAQFLQERYANDIGALNRRWKSRFKDFDSILYQKGLPHATRLLGAALEDEEAFLYLTARRYFDVCSKALRSYDANHLLLGPRFLALWTYQAVVRASAETQDVVSVNLYTYLPGLSRYLPRWVPGRLISIENGLDEYFALTGKPILISEFGIRAVTPQTESTWPPFYPTYHNQKERAAALSRFLQRHARQPYVVGAHIFQYMDQPQEGRVDGENNNWGLVSLDDEPYSEVIRVLSDFSKLF